ncbi:tyrosine-type recombinase/integrase [Sphingobium cupriresistens]|uniref:Site-specific integrase n=1 Tax=Sphingobium cupriresistens TaxID=1132417 RepID=A0A8G1ZF44_9SPHN|nr:tyrosine-type recombinase/integrase [Sphingobium cupriresistens]RYM09533.1 site-specific integrase [Sphingobium cupriresistens]
MAEAVHEILGGKVQLFQRPNSKRWHCRASIGGAQHRHSTKQVSLAQAKDVAEDWYLTLAGKAARGEIKAGKTFKYAAERFMVEFKVLTEGQRSPLYVRRHEERLNLYLVPFFGNKVLSEITSGMVQDYRIDRITKGSFTKPKADESTDLTKRRRNGKAPSRSTLHQEMVCLRQVLKFSRRHGWLELLPDLSDPYRASSKVSHRAWFSPAEYQTLYEAARERAANPKKERWRTACEDLLDYILFMANTGLRPDEAKRIEIRDIEIVQDGPKRERILHIAVRGKRGTGWAKSMPGAVHPFTRMKERHNLQPSDLIFPTLQRELFNTLLDELDMKKDREGNARTFYSLRHTYISTRLLEGADIYQIAKNCRTSVEMIEKHYAAHIKDMIDAASVNIRRPKPRR